MGRRLLSATRRVAAGRFDRGRAQAPAVAAGTGAWLAFAIICPGCGAVYLPESHPQAALPAFEARQGAIAALASECPDHPYAILVGE